MIPYHIKQRFQCFSSPQLPSLCSCGKVSTNLVLVGRARLPLLYYALLRTLSILSHIRDMNALLWAAVIIAAIIFFQELAWRGCI